VRFLQMLDVVANSAPGLRSRLVVWTLLRAEDIVMAGLHGGPPGKHREGFFALLLRGNARVLSYVIFHTHNNSLYL
jgi:hypothetical protein